MLRALIFDVDGTLTDNEETHRQAFNAAFLEMNLGWQWSVADYTALLEISGGKERLAWYFDHLDASAAERQGLHQILPMIHRTKTRHYRELAAAGALRLRPGVARLLREARQRGLRLGVATTTTLENVNALLGSELALDTFDAVAAGDLAAHKKPAPDIYHLVLSTLRVPANECVAFEDSANGLAAARAAGLVTVVTPTQWSAGHDFSAANLLVPHLGDRQQPYDPATAARVGAPFLGVDQLERLLASAVETN